MAAAQPQSAVDIPIRGVARRAHLTSNDVWRAIAKASFAYVAHVTPSGEPRASGVAFGTVGRSLFIVVSPDSWKAKCIAATGRVAVVVPVRRGGLLSLFLPVPPATISLHAKALLRQPGSMSDLDALPKHLRSGIPAERTSFAQVVELIPQGEFLTYGLGVSLLEMMQPSIAQARVPVNGSATDS